MRGSLNLSRFQFAVRSEESPAEKRVPTKYSEERKLKLQNKKEPGPAMMITNIVRYKRASRRETETIRCCTARELCRNK